MEHMARLRRDARRPPARSRVAAAVAVVAVVAMVAGACASGPAAAPEVAFVDPSPAPDDGRPSVSTPPSVPGVREDPAAEVRSIDREWSETGGLDDAGIPFAEASTGGGDAPYVPDEGATGVGDIGRSPLPDPGPDEWVPDDRAGTGAVDGADDEGGTGATGIDDAAWERFEDEVGRALLRGGVRSASVAVSVDGHPARSAAFGERVPDRGEATEVTHRLRIASISKVVTAIVVMRFVEAGWLPLREPVGERIAASLGVAPADPRLSGVTIEHLLSHTSGIPRHQAVFFGDGARSCRDAARTVVTRPIGVPGRYQYSNANTCLLSVLLEDLTGEDYVDVVRAQLLDPLGLDGMRLAGTYDLHPDEVVHPSRPGRAYMEALGAAGGWVATPTDIARILGSLDPRAPGWRPLSDTTIDVMRTVPAWSSEPYGLGLMLHPDGSIGHTGTVEQTRAMALQRPDGITWVALVNGERPGSSSALRGIVDGALATAGILGR